MRSLLLFCLFTAGLSGLPFSNAGAETHFVPLGDLNTQPVTAAPASAGASVTGSADYFFAGTDPERGTEVWRWSGSGTASLFAEIRPGPDGGSPAQFTAAAAGRVVFVSDDGYSGPEIWVTTGGSVTRLPEVQPGNVHPAPTIIGAAGGWVWFTTPRTSGSTARTEIWATDGVNITQSGFVAENTITQITSVANQASLLFLATPLGGSRSNLYCAKDNDALITVAQIRDDGTPPLPSTPVYAATASFVCFHRTDSTNDEPYVWSYSGSAVTLKNINATGNSAPTHFVSNGTNTVCFAATTAAEGRELWQTNGTTGSTVLASDTVSGPGSSNPEPLPMRYNQPHVFFRTMIATTPACWYLNVAIGPTSRQMVATDVTGWLFPTMVGPSELLFFLPSGAQWRLMQVTEKSTEPFLVSGTPFETVEALWNHVRPDDGSSRNPFLVAQFTPAGRELWKINTSSLTLLDPGTGPASSDPRWFGAQGTSPIPTLVLGANLSSHATNFYWVAGSSLSQVPLATTPFFGNRSSFPADFIETDHGLVFSAMAYSPEYRHFRGLWTSSGPNTAWRLNDVVHVEQLVKFQDRVFLLAQRYNEPGGVKRLHYLSFTPWGAAEVQLFPPAAGFAVKRLLPAAGKLFFVRQEATSNEETLRCILPDFSEGPPQTFTKGADGIGITQLTATSGHLFFSAAYHTGRRPWHTDGVNPAVVAGHPAFNQPQFLGALGDTAVFFTRNDTNGALLLWDPVNGTPLQVGSIAPQDTPRVQPDGRPSGLEFGGEFLYTTATRSSIFKTSFNGMGTLASNGNLSASTERMAVFGGQLFYFARAGSNWRVFASDGFTPGTPLDVDFSFQTPTGLFVEPGSGLRFGMSSTNQVNLWKSDGTAVGTAQSPSHYDLARRDLSSYHLPMGTLRGHLVVPYEEFAGDGMEPALLNSPPELAHPAYLSGLRGEPLTFTYADLIPTPPTDDDGDPLAISIASLHSGILERNGEPYNAGDPILPGDTFNWEPPAGYSGPTTILELQADDGFDTGSQYFAAFLNSPLDLWRQTQFTAEELLDNDLVAEWADPDHDGVGNGLEFIFGRQAKTAETEAGWSANVITQSGGPSHLRLRFTRTATLTEGTTLVIEHSPTLLPDLGTGLVPWNTVNTKTENGPWSDPEFVIETPLPDGRVQVDAMLPAPLDAATLAGFLRLRVEL